MAALTRWKASRCASPGRHRRRATLGFLQFVVNFTAVYLAEHPSSGLVATVFALLLIPNSLLGWALLGPTKPGARFAISFGVRVAGIAMLFAHELGEHPARTDAILLGISLTLIGSWGVGRQRLSGVRTCWKRFSLFALLTWRCCRAR